MSTITFYFTIHSEKTPMPEDAVERSTAKIHRVIKEHASHISSFHLRPVEPHKNTYSCEIKTTRNIPLDEKKALVNAIKTAIKNNFQQSLRIEEPELNTVLEKMLDRKDYSTLGVLWNTSKNIRHIIAEHFHLPKEFFSSFTNSSMLEKILAQKNIFANLLNADPEARQELKSPEDVLAFLLLLDKNQAYKNRWYISFNHPEKTAAALLYFDVIPQKTWKLFFDNLFLLHETVKCADENTSKKFFELLAALPNYASILLYTPNPQDNSGNILIHKLSDPAVLRHLLERADSKTRLAILTTPFEYHPNTQVIFEHPIEYRPDRRRAKTIFEYARIMRKLSSLELLIELGQAILPENKTRASPDFFQAHPPQLEQLKDDIKTSQEYLERKPSPC